MARARGCSDFYDFVLKHCQPAVQADFDKATETYVHTVHLPRIAQSAATTCEVTDFDAASEALKMFFNKKGECEVIVSQKGLVLKTRDLVLMPCVWRTDAEGRLVPASGKTRHLLVYKNTADGLAEDVLRLLAKFRR